MFQSPAPYHWNGQQWAPSPVVLPNAFGQRPRKKAFLGCMRRDKEPDVYIIPPSPGTVHHHHHPSPKTRRRRQSMKFDDQPGLLPFGMMPSPMYPQSPHSPFRMMGSPLHPQSPHTPFGTPLAAMTPIFPSNRRSPSPTSDRSSSPWTNIEELDEDLSVIDVQHNLPILHNLAITVNPSISCTLNDFPLIVDLRLSVDRIWKRPQPGWDANVEPFTGAHEPATMPALNMIYLLSPLFETPIKVINPEGRAVTCGDVIEALADLAQAEITENAWRKLKYMEKADARRRFVEQRAFPHSIFNPQNLVNADTWQGRVTFEGIRKDDAMTKRRLGWVNPACFWVDLEEPEHEYRYE